MIYYEILDRKTNTQFQATARNFQQACEINGHKVRNCHLVYSAKVR